MRTRQSSGLGVYRFARACLWASQTLATTLIRGLRRLHPAQQVFMGYSAYVLAGWVLLCLPCSVRTRVGALDHLFVATSAVSTTGLTPVSVADSYSFFGQSVILIMIQLGGIGYMTLGSFLILARSTGLSPVRTAIGQTVFSLPAGFRLAEFIRSVIGFTVVIETLGAIALYFVFANVGADHLLWRAVVCD